MSVVRTIVSDSKIFWKTLIILVAPIFLSPLLIFFDSEQARCGYTIALMGVYWIFEVLPLPVTGFLPMILFPCLGTMEAKRAASLYFQDTTMIFFGGLMIALAIERVDLHKRIGTGILLLVGSTPSRILIGFLLPTSFLSMWINNTATASMMLPAVEAVITQYRRGLETNTSTKATNNVFTVDNHVETEEGKNSRKKEEMDGVEQNCKEDDKKPKSYDNQAFELMGTTIMEVNVSERNECDPSTTSNNLKSPTIQEISDDKKMMNFSKMLSLAVAFGSLVGGTATLTGSTTNLLVAEEVGRTFEERGEKSPLTYASWLFFGLPHAAVCLLVLWAWLQIYFLGWRSLNVFSKSKNDGKILEQEGRMKEILRSEYDKLGPMKLGEILMVVLMLVLILLWILRDPGFIPGYASLFQDGYVTDSFPPMLVSILLFVLPMEKPNFMCWRKPNERAKKVASLLDWETVTTRLPWGPLLLIGSGFVLAEGCRVSGLSELIADQLNGLSQLPHWVTAVIVTIIVSMITEIIANVTVMALFSPILIAMADNFGINPLFFVFPSGIASSYAYMLPVAAPSNAIVFAYGHLSVIDMVKVGFVLKMICLVVITIMTNTLGVIVFNLNEIPWQTNSTVSPNNSLLLNFTSTISYSETSPLF